MFNMIPNAGSEKIHFMPKYFSIDAVRSLRLRTIYVLSELGSAGKTGTLLVKTPTKAGS